MAVRESASPSPVLAPGDELNDMSPEQVLEFVSQSARLPSIAERIIELANDDSSRLEDLGDVLRTDPVLVAQILRRVNSRYYGLCTEVPDLKSVGSLLGFREVCNLALTVVVARLFEEEATYGALNRTVLWNHSVAVAATAHLISRVCGRAIPGEAYLAGLLHDLGYVMLDIYCRNQLTKVLAELDGDVPTHIVERRQLGFEHSRLGAHVASQWQLPPGVTDAIHYHHEADAYFGVHRETVFSVTVANYFCSRAGWNALGVHNVPPPSDNVYAGLGLDEVALSIIWSEMRSTFDKAQLLATL